MRPFLPAVAALVAGIVLGAWQPRGELLRLRQENDELRTKASKPCRGAAADRIRTILRAEPPPVPATEPAGEAPAAEVDPASQAAAPAGPAAQADAPSMSPEDIERTKEQMRAALDARRAQARAALVEQAELDDEEVAKVDAIVDDMNAQIKAEVDRFVDAAVERGDVDRRDIMDFAAESLDVVIATDDRMRQTLGDEVYAAVDDSAVDPLSYLSGDTLDSLARLQDVPGFEGE